MTEGRNQHEENDLRFLLDTAAQAHVTNDKDILYDIGPCCVTVRGQIFQRQIRRKGKSLLECSNDG
jgi:hypothetical protein